MRLARLGEFNLIDRISKGIKLSGDVIRGIGDDAAVLKYTKDKYLLYTCDMMLEGRHFVRAAGGYLAGKKALSVNISDIAAMGGTPKYAVISLGVPASLDLRYVDDLYRGIKDVAGRFKIDLVGGDTIASEKIIINITLIGEVEKKRVALRSGAKAGDLIFITGRIGGSFSGRHLDFTPRLKESLFLVKNFKINSMIDISDGLIADLGHILKSSKAGAIIYERQIPLSGKAKDFNSAVRSGEDFELVFTVPSRQGTSLIKKWPFRTRLSKIGKICSASDLCLIRKDGKKEKIKPEGYSHF